jgi:uncharacterized protein (TIGR03000 family)
MMFRRCLWALLAVSFVLVAAADSDGSGRGPAVVQSPYYGYPPVFVPGYMYSYGFPYNTPYGYPYTVPYVAPYPAYGILPPPIQGWQNVLGGGSAGKSGAETKGSDAINYEPRKRGSVYPAVPFGTAPEEQRADLSRARFEITVPTADAVVLFDGVKMKQTGLKREYVTPPLRNDKEYAATIEVSWQDEAGTTVRRKKSFDFVSGQRITHTFSE